MYLSSIGNLGTDYWSICLQLGCKKENLYQGNMPRDTNEGQRLNSDQIQETKHPWRGSQTVFWWGANCSSQPDVNTSVFQPKTWKLEYDIHIVWPSGEAEYFCFQSMSSFVRHTVQRMPQLNARPLQRAVTGNHLSQYTLFCRILNGWVLKCRHWKIAYPWGILLRT